jgi:hypothetical protein
MSRPSTRWPAANRDYVKLRRGRYRIFGFRRAIFLAIEIVDGLANEHAMANIFWDALSFSPAASAYLDESDWLEKKAPRSGLKEVL